MMGAPSSPRGPRRKVLSLSLLVIISTALVLLLTAPSPVAAVREHDFKKCADSSFCRRLRRLSDYVAGLPSKQAFISPYSLPEAPVFDAATASLTAPISSALHPSISFELKVNFHKDGTARVRMDQVGETFKGWKRYDEAAMWGIENQPIAAAEGEVDVDVAQDKTVVSFGPSKLHQLELQHVPFRATFLRAGVPQMVLNDRGLLHMEHFRPKPTPFPSPAEEHEAKEDGTPSLHFQKKRSTIAASIPGPMYTPAQDQIDNWAGFEKEDSGEWEESWQGKHDSKPKGPEALSLDISFPGKSFAFGLPEHASPLNLRDTRGKKEGDFKDPYRLMNTDVFEYLHDSPMSLYGSVPVLHAQSKDDATSVLWMSGSETWIDIDREGDKGSLRTHWISESGILDLFVFLEDKPQKNIELFTGLVGRTVLPQYFAMGYHQCRWNYLSTDDVLTVNDNFNKADMPMDVMWLDIEYSLEHMYGVWNEQTFPKPERMLEGLDANGRKLVIIIDPHLKRTRDYFLYAEAQDQDVLVKSPDGKGEYEGWCWSGSASWLDFFNPKSWEWWSKEFSLAAKKIKANARNMFIWNDMNEPAIFNGPEITSPKDVKHYGGWEHRDLHNINAVLFQNATARGLKERETPNRRPFVLGRGWWIGTQKYGAVWTGDNLGTWEHLAVSVPMILSNNVAGMSFCGADIGGFFAKDPEPEFLLRWYQAGIFEPFFRAHAHIDTKRREPFLLEEPYKSHVRELLKLRYRLLPAWYTAFKEDGASGKPILRPHFLMFPDDANGFAIDDQYFIGDTGLLVKPAVAQGVTSVEMYLPEERPYYNFFSHDVYFGTAGGRRVTVPAPLTEVMPLLHRGGSILPLRQRARRSAELAWRDPLTLIVALDKVHSASPKTAEGSAVRAEGLLYLDDGQTYDYEKGAFIWRRFRFSTEEGGKRHVVSSLDEASLRSSGVEKPLADPVPQVPATYDAEGNAFARSISDVRVERIVILGLEDGPKSVKARSASGEEREVDFVFEPGASSSSWRIGLTAKGGRASRLTIRDPAVLVAQDWTIVLE